MILRPTDLAAALAAIVLISFLAQPAVSITVQAADQASLPSGQYMFVTMTIDDAKTRFELTGPDFSWFAFGFDTTSMFGYSLIIQGTDGTRTATEQNLEGTGAPGIPQATQNLSIIGTTHDDVNNRTTIILERLNKTGDPDDPVFSPSIAALDIIAAYDSFSSPAVPNGALSFHGPRGRGNGYLEFLQVPEPTSVSLAALSVGVILVTARRRRPGAY